MSDLPLPLPDRRILLNSNNQQFNSFPNSNFTKEKYKNSEKQNNNNIIETTKANSLSLIKLKQIEDMRQKILNIIY